MVSAVADPMNSARDFEEVVETTVMSTIVEKESIHDTAQHCKGLAQKGKEGYTDGRNYCDLGGHAT